jgi:hypothetical protein
MAKKLDLWELGRRVEITVPVIQPYVKFEGGGAQGSTVFACFPTEVYDDNDEYIGSVSGGTGVVKIFREGDEGTSWMIRHSDIWNAFVEAVQGVGPIPVVEALESEDDDVAEPGPEPVSLVESVLPPELTYEPKSASDPELEDDIVYLDITTYRGGVSLGAIHWYGKLKPWKGKSVELQCVLTGAQAQRLSDSTFTFDAGDRTIRWESREKLIECAIDMYKEYFPGAKVLLLGGNRAMPCRVIAGLSDSVAARMSAIFQEGEDLGWYGRRDDYDEANDISDRWFDLLGEVTGREFNWNRL